MSEYDAQTLDRLAPAYMARMGLHSPPFGERSDGRFLYLDPDRAQRLSLIQHLTQYSELLLLVKGARGSGKTSLLGHYIDQADAQWRLCHVQANAMLDAERLLYAIAEGFGLDVGGGDQRELVYRFAADQHHAGRIPVLVIDDAHELPADALEAVFLLADAETADGAGLLRILLFCEPQIDALLDAPALHPYKERITHTLEMPLLDDEQTAAYLRHRLAAAGYRGPALFSDRAVRRIHKSAQGLPGRINEVAHHWLLHSGEEKEGRRLLARLAGIGPRPVLMGGGLLIVLLAVWVLQDRINALFESTPRDTQTVSLPLPSGQHGNTDAHPSPLGEVPAVSPAPAPDNTPATTSAAVPAAAPAHTAAEAATAQPVAPPAQESVVVTEEPEPVQDSAAATVPPTSMVPGETTARNGQETTAPMPTASPAGASATQAVTPEQDLPASKPEAPPVGSGPGSAPAPAAPKLTALQPEPVIGARTPQVLTLKGSGFRPGLSVTVSWDGSEKRLSPSQVQVDSDSRLRLTLTTGTRNRTWTVQVSDPQHGTSNRLRFTVKAPQPGTAGVIEATPSANKVAATVPAGGVLGEDWLRSRDADHYTLQLLSTHTAENVSRFVREHHLGGEVAQFHSRHDGQSWYTVVRGDYASRQAAESAAAHLPTSLKGIKPWIRRFGDIQAQLSTAAATAAMPASKPVQASPSATSPVLAGEQPATDLPGRTRVSRPPADRPGGSAALAWLWDQDPRHYTLQLLGARSEASLQAYIHEHHLEGKAVYFKTLREGLDWYSLVYGVYADRAKAVQAIASLPAGLRQSQPWARSFASIHSELSPADH